MPQKELTSRTFPKVLIEVRTGHTRTPKKTPFSQATILNKCEALLRYADLTYEEGGYKEQASRAKLANEVTEIKNRILSSMALKQNEELDESAKQLAEIAKQQKDLAIQAAAITKKTTKRLRNSEGKYRGMCIGSRKWCNYNQSGAQVL